MANLEKGKREITSTELVALAWELDRPLSWFFLPVEGESLELSSGWRITRGEFLNGPLLGGESGNGLQALVQEALDIVNTFDLVRVELDKRA